jgi:hypothetical protein
MRRAASVLGLSLCLLGCGSAAPAGEPVELLTGHGPFASSETSGLCFTNFVVGQLVVDGGAGTAIIVDDEHGGSDLPVPVMWRPGFTGRLVGSEVLVLDPAGNVQATTGRRYKIAGGYWSDAFLACDFVIQQ